MDAEHVKREVEKIAAAEQDPKRFEAKLKSLGAVWPEYRSASADRFARVELGPGHSVDIVYYIDEAGAIAVRSVDEIELISCWFPDKSAKRHSKRAHQAH